MNPVFYIAVVLGLCGVVLLFVATRVRNVRGLGAGETVALDDVTLFSARLMLVGRPDRIVKQGGAYTPEEWKSAKRVSHGHRLQLGTYFLLVEETYGVRPPFGVVVLGDGSRVRVENTAALCAEVLRIAAENRETPPSFARLRRLQPLTEESQQVLLRQKCRGPLTRMSPGLIPAAPRASRGPGFSPHRRIVMIPLDSEHRGLLKRMSERREHPPLLAEADAPYGAEIASFVIANEQVREAHFAEVRALFGSTPPVQRPADPPADGMAEAARGGPDVWIAPQIELFLLDEQTLTAFARQVGERNPTWYVLRRSMPVAPLNRRMLLVQILENLCVDYRLLRPHCDLTHAGFRFWPLVLDDEQRLRVVREGLGWLNDDTLFSLLLSPNDLLALYTELNDSTPPEDPATFDPDIDTIPGECWLAAMHRRGRESQLKDLRLKPQKGENPKPT